MAPDHRDESNGSSGDRKRGNNSLTESRRRFLAGLGAAGATALAGCSNDDETPTEGSGDETDGDTDGSGDDGTDTTTGGGGDRSDDVAEGVVDGKWTQAMWQTADDPVFNRWNTDGSGALGIPIYSNLAEFNAVTRNFEPILASDWEYNTDEGYLDVTLIEGLTWHNGKDLTAEDIVVRWDLERYVTAKIDVLKESGKIESVGGVWNFVDDVTAKNARTVRFHVPEPVNSQLLLRNAIWDTVNTPRFIYGKWVDKFKEAKSDPEKFNKVRSNFQSWKQPDPVGSSPWQVEQMATNKVTMSLYEDHPFAENVNYSDFETLAAQQNKDHWALFNSERTNVLNAAAPDTVVNSFPKSAFFVKDIVPNYFGSSLNFNLNADVVGKRKVRQALAYVIDARNPADANGYIPVTDNFTGIGGGPAGVPGRVLGDVRDKFQDYDVSEGTGGEDWKKAAALLEEAGLSKQNGTWMRENGDPFKLPVKVVAAHSDMVKQFQVVVGQLKEFGIDATLETVEGATFWDMRSRGDWVACEEFWVASFPYTRFDIWYNFDGEQHQASGRPPVIKDIPKPFDHQGSETVDINMRKKTQQLAQEPDQEKQRELLQQLAWGFNQDMPLIPIEERMVGTPFNPEGQGIPFIIPNLTRPKGARGTELDSEDRAALANVMGISQNYLLHQGYIAAKAQND